MRRLPVAILTVAAGALAACGPGRSSVDGLGVPLHQPVSERQLRSLPQSSLLIPGSQLIRQIGADEHAHPGDPDPDPAFAGVVATTTAPAAALLSRYDDELTARGYQRAPYYRPSDQVLGSAWTIPHSREQVQVGVYAAGAAAAGNAGGTVYEELLVSYRVTGPPPPPSR
jgi:hypothetical protein